MKNILYSIFILVLSSLLTSCDDSSDSYIASNDIVWIYDYGSVPEADIVSAQVSFKDNGAYLTGYFELSVRNITYPLAKGLSDNISLQIDFYKNSEVERPRPAYNVKGSTQYVALIAELYEIDDTPMLDWDSYPSQLRVNDELFEGVFFKKK